MVSVTGTIFKAMMGQGGDDSFTVTYAEYLIDQAIYTLNLYLSPYDIAISNMSGTAGSKTLTVDARTAGAIYLVASTAYSGFYKASGSGSSSTSVSLGQMSTSESASSSSGKGGSDIHSVAQQVALLLRDLEVEAECV